MSGDGLRAPVNAPPALGAPVGVSGGNPSGVLRVRKIIVSGAGQGIYTYGGTPAAGNLIETAGLSEDGTDGFGNATLAGTTSYEDTGSFIAAVNIFGGVINFYEAATEAGPYTLFAGIGFQFGGGIGGLALSDSGAGVVLNSHATAAAPLASTPAATAAAIIVAGRSLGLWP